MRKCVLTLCVLGGLIAPDVQAAGKTTNTGKVTGRWHHSYADAYFEAKRLGLPLVVHFYTDWCGPCQQMESTVLNTSEVTSKLGRSAVGVKINADHHARLTSQFGIGSYPADVYVGPNGKILFRSSGYSSPRTYSSQIARANDRVEEQMLAASGSKPTDPAAEPALNGYSPVAIIQHKEWKKGDAAFAWEHEGVVYHLQSAQELELFKAGPQRYIPGLAGNDPLELSMEGREVPGDIRYGVFFRGKLFLLTSDKNRQEFMNQPKRIAESAEKLQTTGESSSLEM